MSVGIAAMSVPATAANVPELQPMTSVQVMAAGAAGTGCSWSLRGDRRMRFAAADDRAAIRIAGRIVALSPTPRARELFPFTFADWRAKDVIVRLKRTGSARWLGSEAWTAGATLTIVSGGTRRRIAGDLSCGS
jgi:hypothetical protein